MTRKKVSRHKILLDSDLIFSDLLSNRRALAPFLGLYTWSTKEDTDGVIPDIANFRAIWWKPKDADRIVRAGWGKIVDGAMVLKHWNAEDRDKYAAKADRFRSKTEANELKSTQIESDVAGNNTESLNSAPPYIHTDIRTATQPRKADGWRDIRDAFDGGEIQGWACDKLNDLIIAKGKEYVQDQRLKWFAGNHPKNLGEFTKWVTNPQPTPPQYLPVPKPIIIPESERVTPGQIKEILDQFNANKFKAMA